MKTVFLVPALLLAACSGGSGNEQAPPPATRIAILGSDGNLSTYDPDLGSTTAITSDAGPGRFYSQPTWSPDGSRLAFSVSTASTRAPSLEAATPTARVGLQAQEAVESAIHIVPAEGGVATVIDTPFPAFYLYWAPDGAWLAFLGNDLSLPGIGLGLIDADASTVERIDTGQPYYFAWSPGSDRMLVHATDAELYFLSLDGTKQTVGPEPGSFTAPSWLGSTLAFPVGQSLRIANLDGTARRQAGGYTAGVALALSPDEERVAYIDIAPGANPFALGALVVDSPDGSSEVSDLATAFFWSPDGARLLYLTPDLAGDDFRMRWNVWDGTTSVAFEPFLPTGTFVQQYLPFFGQYANSLSFFSPDGRSFTFAGSIADRGEGIWVQEIDGGPAAEFIGAGEFSTWAPAPPDPGDR